MNKVIIYSTALFFLTLIHAQDLEISEFNWGEIRKSIDDEKISASELAELLEIANEYGFHSDINELSDLILSKDNYKNNPHILNELGTSAFNTGHQGDSAILFKKALAIYPGFPEAHANLGVIYRIKGEYETALEHLKFAIDNLPPNATLFYNISICYERLNMLEEAENNLRKTIEIDNKFKDAYKTLAYLLISQDKDEEALNLLRVYSGLVGGKDEDALMLIKQLSD